ncbi:MAG: hypothetical protein ACJA0N_002602 [Pseudohongiellaceae bacterium]|jgi:hypothetical protein
MQNMMPQDPLAGLRDIHTPDAIGLWPLAPGWYLVALLTLLILTGSIYLWRKSRKQGAYKRSALQQLQLLKQNPCSDRQYLQHLNGLLKQTALATQPRQAIAGLNGSPWLNFLDQHGQTDQHYFSQGYGQVLAHGPYQAQQPDVNREQLDQLVQQWIKRQGRAC